MYTLNQAIALSVVVSSSYVYAIYINDSVNKLPRNHPTTIKGRIKNVSISNILIVILVPLILHYLQGFPTYFDAFKVLGLIPGLNANGKSVKEDLGQIVNCVLLMASLYLGPILNYFLFEGGFRSLTTDFFDSFCTIWGVRNNIFAPITEEIIYTSVILSIFKPLDIPSDHLIKYTPILFGFAHLHHGLELYKLRQQYIYQILLSCSFQFLYTTMFGMLTNFIFLRTCNIWCCIFVHSFCNLNGFPTFDVDSKWGWKYVYYVLLVYGAFIFRSNLYTLTE